MTDQYKISEELVVLDEQGTVYLIPPWAPVIRLNRSASIIWRAVADHDSVVVASATLAERENLSQDRASDLVRNFLQSLEDRGLIKRAAV